VEDGTQVAGRVGIQEERMEKCGVVSDRVRRASGPIDEDFEREVDAGRRMADIK
jgi:hypothetical protein